MGKSTGTGGAGDGRIGAPAGVFLLVAFLAAGALGAAQAGTPIPGEVIQLTQFGSALGVAAVALLWPGRTRALLAGALRSGELRWGRGLLLLLTAPLITAVAVGAHGAVTGGVRFTGPGALESPFAVIVVAQLAGACGEEIGWRCLLQPLLRTRLGPLAASVVVGLVWGVWHVQVFTRAPLYAGAFLVMAVSLSVVMGLALERVRGSRLLLAGGFHALINLGMLMFMDEESGAVLPMALTALAALAAAVGWTAATAVATRREAPARVAGPGEAVRLP
ncbi:MULTISPECIES: CPBP family intramembrane glutamic endopeptidase [unclassified Streptomyces]|uniref:CPBP family intramembrane glutamic endopeptidase n=1 Tax=unclassified Streptomyces TaxID=2593676 RepID=UPI002254FD11|nr:MULTISPECIES: CPBP family intramembrane glutamic endopeptidase [unclassified Streptomyces]MCX4526985.1 CPBP family intramembrane metalloprotease [Streptomyces sp. NBC_01551]MCX4542455.1 CPBP family intramembrane metalloprotease [Streptomyces sp. NBC_01565]